MRLIDADALLKHEISADRMGAMLVVGKGHILGAPTIAGEIVTPEMKARILDRFEKADDLAEKQDELIERLQKRLSVADAGTSDAICFEVEDYQNKIDELRGAISSILTASIHGQDACANYDSAYHHLCDIEKICTQILG